MRIISVLFATTVLLAVALTPRAAEARSGIGFGYYGPGVSIYVGPRYRYYRPYPYYYRPYYRPYRRYYAPRRAYGGRCAKWSRRCAANWGYRNRNYYGCLRYHRCR